MYTYNYPPISRSLEGSGKHFVKIGISKNRSSNLLCKMVRVSDGKFKGPEKKFGKSGILNNTVFGKGKEKLGEIMEPICFCPF